MAYTGKEVASGPLSPTGSMSLGISRLRGTFCAKKMNTGSVSGVTVVGWRGRLRDSVFERPWLGGVPTRVRGCYIKTEV